MRLVEVKHLLLVESGGQRAEALGGLADRLASLRAGNMQAGKAALEPLERVRAELRFVEDVWIEDELGDFFKTTKAQLSSIDTASHYARDAQRHLHTFQERLADASLRIHVAFHVDEFSTFAKSFFDGWVSDWVVKSKIQAASKVCGTTIAAVSATLAECERQLAEVERSTEAVTEQRRQFIEEA